MLFRFKKDCYVPLYDLLDDKYVDNCFIFKKDYCYNGNFEGNYLVIENKDNSARVIINKLHIDDFIDWKGL